jgi:hypothetical protein
MKTSVLAVKLPFIFLGSSATYDVIFGNGKASIAALVLFSCELCSFLQFVKAWQLFYCRQMKGSMFAIPVGRGSLIIKLWDHWPRRWHPRHWAGQGKCWYMIWHVTEFSNVLAFCSRHK